MAKRHCPNHQDTPEEVAEYYQQTWCRAIREEERLRGLLRLARSKRHRRRLRRFHRSAVANRDAFHGMYQAAQAMLASYRFQLGFGTAIPVPGRPGQHAAVKPMVPLTVPEDCGPPWEYVALDSLPPEIRCRVTEANPTIVRIRFPDASEPDYRVGNDWYRWQPCSTPRKGKGLYRLVYRWEPVTVPRQ